MTRDDLKQVIIDELTKIAPEIDRASIAPAAALREELDLDSMDFLNFVLALHQRLGIDIPETDYPRLYSLDGAIEYLATRLGEPAGNPAPVGSDLA
jgi:acyl carrier protein